MVELSGAEAELHNKLCHVDSWYWAQHAQIELQGGNIYNTRNHEYQIGPLQSTHPYQVWRKAAQMGITELMVIRTLHRMITGYYNKGVLYLFPTEGDVSDFSKARFKPLIDSNPEISAHVKSTDATNIKQVGQAMLYLRGARANSQKIEGAKKTSSRLKSIAVDAIIMDESDEMESEMKVLAKWRVSHSDLKHEFGRGNLFQLSTPTIPDYGIDYEYSLSNRMVWMIKCGGCGEYTCAEQEFPEFIRIDEHGRGYKCCKRCGREIHTRHGEWVAERPSVLDLEGRWISQLNSAYIDPGHILKMFNNPPNGNIAEVYNSTLGLPYIKAENRLTKNDVLACCTDQLQEHQSDGPCAMGVDVGNTLHYVIGCKLSGDRRRIIKIGKVDNFGDLKELERRYNVKATVIDSNPDTHAARSHQRSSKSEVFLCTYSDHQAGDIKFDHDNGRVLVNRNEILDRTHNLVVDRGKLELPKFSSDIDEYAFQMTQIAKTYVESKAIKGLLVSKYVKTGGGSADDHFRHATGYFEIACERVNDYRQKKRQGSDWDNNDNSLAKTDW